MGEGGGGRGKGELSPFFASIFLLFPAKKRLILRLNVSRLE